VDASTPVGAGARARGVLGETLACLFLESRGYRIVARNLRLGRNEIDLIAERSALLVAVEVKWRRVGGSRPGTDGAWSIAQRRRAREAVLGAMAAFEEGTKRPWRFDLVTIEEDATGFRLDHRRGVWSPPGTYW
jgi:putative endonuclease